MNGNREEKFKPVKILLGIITVFLLLITSFGCSTNFNESTLTGAKQANLSSDPLNFQASNKILKVSYLDVGQADSILIQIPNGKNLLIDAGNNEDTEQIVSTLESQGIRRLDVVIGTHPHEDHIGSLDTVIQTFDIGQVLMPKVTNTTETYKDVLKAIQKKGLKITEAKAGLKLDLGSQDSTGTSVSAEVIAPNSTHYEEMNNYSIVLRLVYGQTAFLFTGDAEKISEEEILKSKVNLKADVLKVGHHGSSSSTTQEFLKKVNPQMAVISVGKNNDYGHPSETILNRLQKSGVRIYRTDLLGTIVVTSNGNQITVSTSRVTKP